MKSDGDNTLRSAALASVRELLNPQVYGLDHRGRRAAIAPVYEKQQRETEKFDYEDRIPTPVPLSRPSTIRSLVFDMQGITLGQGICYALILVAGWCVQQLHLLPASAPVALNNLIGVVTVIIGIRVATLVGPGKIVRERQIPSVIHAYLRRNRCPGCGQSLKNLKEASDGCVTCAECGAAWAPDAYNRQNPFDCPPETDWAKRPKVTDFRGWRYPCSLRTAIDGLGFLADSMPMRIRFFTSGFTLIGPAVATLVGLLIWLRDNGSAGEAILAFLLVVCVVTGLCAYFFQKHERRCRLRDWCSSRVRARICPCCDGPLPGTGERFQRGVVCPACGGDWDPSGKIHVQGDVP
jgi:ribosomal protein L37AE/L43A